MSVCITFKCSYALGYYVDDAYTLKKIPSFLQYYFIDLEVGKGEFTVDYKDDMMYLLLSEKLLFTDCIESLDAFPSVYFTIVSKKYVLTEAVYAFPIYGKYAPFILKSLRIDNTYDLAIANIDSENFPSYMDILLHNSLLKHMYEEYKERTTLMFSYENERGERTELPLSKELEIPFAKNIVLYAKKSIELKKDIVTHILKLREEHKLIFEVDFVVPVDLNLPSYPFLLKLNGFYEELEELTKGDFSLYNYVNQKRGVSLACNRRIKELPTFIYDEYQEQIVEYNKEAEISAYIYESYFNDEKELVPYYAYSFLLVV